MSAPLCLVRAVPASFSAALCTDNVELNVAMARRQHAGYVAALKASGCQVLEVPADDAFPDCCFIEDTAVVLGETAVLTRPGAASRQGEVDGVAEVLGKHRELVRMRAPAALDGGDVLRIGMHLFIGISERTNKDGALFLAAAARREGIESTLLDVPEGLHLKSFVTLAATGTLVHDERLEVEAFEAAGFRCLVAPEPVGANVLAVGVSVLVSEDAVRTADMLEQRVGLRVRRVHVSEFHKADGALTCLSLRLAGPGGWAT